jgi:hypothetical protein
MPPVKKSLFCRKHRGGRWRSRTLAPTLPSTGSRFRSNVELVVIARNVHFVLRSSGKRPLLTTLAVASPGAPVGTHPSSQVVAAPARIGPTAVPKVWDRVVGERVECLTAPLQGARAGAAQYT